jgi:hypothetical protein
VQKLLTGLKPRAARIVALTANGGVIAYAVRDSDGGTILRIRATDGSWSTLPLRSAPAGILIDNRTVAVWTPAGRVELFSESGAPLATVTVSAPRAVALRNGELVVVSGRGTIDVYDLASGMRTLSRPLPAATTAAVSVRFDIATVSSGRSVYAIRLADGRTATIARTPGRPLARIGDAGIAYAWNSAGRGTVEFVPMHTVQALLAAAA